MWAWSWFGVGKHEDPDQLWPGTLPPFLTYSRHPHQWPQSRVPSLLCVVDVPCALSSSLSIFAWGTLPFSLLLVCSIFRHLFWRLCSSGFYIIRPFTHKVLIRPNNPRWHHLWAGIGSQGTTVIGPRDRTMRSSCTKTHYHPPPSMTLLHCQAINMSVQPRHVE